MICGACPGYSVRRTTCTSDRSGIASTVMFDADHTPATTRKAVSSSTIARFDTHH